MYCLHPQIGSSFSSQSQDFIGAWSRWLGRGSPGHSSSTPKLTFSKIQGHLGPLGTDQLAEHWPLGSSSMRDGLPAEGVAFLFLCLMPASLWFYEKGEENSDRRSWCGSSPQGEGGQEDGHGGCAVSSGGVRKAQASFTVNTAQPLAPEAMPALTLADPKALDGQNTS
jgi:hypothetical protein